jgi:hypothetical protein
MNPHRRLSLLLLFILAAQLAFAANILDSLKRGHPRLYIDNAEMARVKQNIAQSPQAQAWYKRLEAEAESIEGQPPVVHRLIGPRLLDQSRRALDRVSTLAGLYRLDGDRAKAERARQEMLTAAAFSDWNPSHFLDTAEMTNALAIGYDWLFDYLSAEDRAAIRAAIVEKGLKQGLKVYAGGKGWSTNRNNWNQVCNGGMTAGALAVADEEPDVAGKVLEYARASIVHSMQSFAPDGGWEEGPGYWSYATRYNVFYLAALRSALGTDFSLSGMEGFADAGMFRIHSLGPLKLTFNFADAHDRVGEAFQMYWFARQFNRSLYARHESELAGERGNIWHLLFSGGRGESPARIDLPLDAVFRRIQVAFFRGAWDDGDAVYVGFKGGDNKAGHSHLDLGTFVMDALGQRWALDLGPDDYNLPGYFGRERWSYYRLRTEGHNTLTIDGENQNQSAAAPLVAFLSTPARAFAVADLSEAYKPKVEKARRGIALLERKQVLVQDEVQAAGPVEIVWNFHTRAQVQIDGARATLALGGAKLEARILAPKDARFELISADAPLPQAQQASVHNLIIRLQRTKAAQVAVLLAPVGAKPPVVQALDEWVAAAPLK